MFGKITEIIDNYVYVENSNHELKNNILNIHVVFPEANHGVVGEVLSVNVDVIKIFLVGEIRNGVFFPGVMRKPSFQTIPRIIYKQELELLIGKQDSNDKSNIYLGKSVTYEQFDVKINLNDFFSNHFAILGNSGSGKSCGVARILQNIFQDNKAGVPQNAHIVLFDVYGEYNDAFKNANNIPNLGYKSYDVDENYSSIKIPAYFLDIDDLALLLNVKSASQLPILEKTLKLVYIFNSLDANVQEYKTEIIAESLLDILSSGRNPNQIRDQIIAILTRYNTKDLNLETPIVQPGYTRTFKQCMNIDASGKMAALDLIITYLQQYKQLDLADIVVNNNIKYGLQDIYYALDFALISEGVLKSEKVYDEFNVLKVRLQQILNSDNRRFFDEGNERITKKEYVEHLFNAEKHYQIINFNLNNVEERFIKILTKIITRLLFNYVTNLRDRGSFPIHVILEEAHRYVQNDTDVEVLGYNIFDRIAKEGRKYGILLGVITQRPSELSTTTLSQCSNFITFKMFHQSDINIISNISSNVSVETIEKIKNLLPGTAIVFGTSFKVPLIVRLDLPNPMPKSTSVDIVSKWY